MKIKFYKKKYLLFMILFISIGFAFLSANLNINGIFNIASSTWDVHFENIEIINNNIEADLPVIDSNKTEVTFSGAFNEPSEVFEFSVDVVNGGSINAMVNEILKTGITSENESFIDFKVNYYDGSEINKLDLLKANSRTRINIKIEYKYEIDTLATLGEQNFSLALNYVSATKEAVDRKNDFQLSDNNNVITLASAKKNSMSNLRIFGNNEQEIFYGQNLYNYKDVDTSIYGVTNGATADEDGWITMSYDNTSGSQTVYSNYFTKNLNLRVGTKYTIVCEVKSVEGTGRLHLLSYFNGYGHFKSMYYSLEDMKNNTTLFYVDEAVESSGQGLRTCTAFNAGESGSITFRISVISGDGIVEEDFKYEPYNGNIPTPNIDNPKEIKSVSGDTTLRIIGKNLFNVNTVKDDTYILDNGEESYNPSWKASQWIDVKENQTYTMHWKSNNNFFQVYFNLFDKNKKLIDRIPIKNYKIFNSFTTPSNARYLKLSYADNVSGVEVERTNIQIEEGTEYTEYEEYKEKIYELSLGNLKLNGVNKYRDYIYKVNNKWFINKRIDKIVLDGVNNKITKNVNINNNVAYEFGFEHYNMVKESSFYSRFPGYCDKLIPSTRNNTFHMFVKSGIAPAALGNDHYGTGAVIYIEDNNQMSVDEFNEWLKTNPLTIYYAMIKPRQIEIKDQNLINQLNAILDDNLYEGYNYLIFDSNIETNIDFDYKSN